ncbi:helix-turn-helix domain-containing protein [Bradyrhizobium sp. SZCCHNS3053]|uniref:helix-turn-helix domain-containing protein n=1 Tax=Bradyrhizobium sp. SZCCHNS3053 TaxID=3057322 RepID=UPI002916DD9E|nr:helix-turn-helix domain-containing protein [Bradyrhizobium sp. SZCCHNS3053]
MSLAVQSIMKQQPSPNKALVIEWIEHILDRKQWNGTDLARAAGLAPSTILRLLNNPKHNFVPTVATLQKIASGSGYPIPKKLLNALSGGGTEMEPDNVKETTVRTIRQPTVELRHISSLPAALQSAVSQKRESYIPAPPQLDGDETAFAFHMPDNTFDPWFKSGCLMFATKRRDPVAGDTVVVTDKNGRSRVRLLMDITEKGLKLSKTHPATEDETVSFDDVSDISIVTIFVKS